jgi:putative DNA primase/helicase
VTDRHLRINLLEEDPELLRALEELDRKEIASGSDAVQGQPLPTQNDVRPPEFADDAIGLRFTEHYGNDLRYTAPWNRWSEWDGSRWRRDETLRIFDLVRKEVRLASVASGDEKLARRVASAMTVAAVERLARSDRRHAATVDNGTGTLGYSIRPAAP